MPEEVRPDLPGAATGAADEAPATRRGDELAEAAAAEAAALETELEELRAALGRLEEGSYGRCEICGAALDDTLLEADPAAARCSAHAPG